MLEWTDANTDHVRHAVHPKANAREKDLSVFDANESRFSVCTRAPGSKFMEKNQGRRLVAWMAPRSHRHLNLRQTGSLFLVRLFQVAESCFLRLSAARLPEVEGMKVLAESFFAHIHPLRCLGFIHKPSFMHTLDQGTISGHYSEALLYTICALGARYAG